MTEAMGDRLAALRGSAAIRCCLIRIALRRRENIPELVVLALDQEQAAGQLLAATRQCRGKRGRSARLR